MDLPEKCDELRRLLHEYVPEVASGVVEIKGIARAPGKRAIVAVWSSDQHIDPIGACIGQRGIRVKTIVQTLSGEKIEIVRWSESMTTFLTNCLYPAQIDDIYTDETAHRAIIFTDFDNKQLITGNKGFRLQLVSELVGLDLQVETG